MDHLTSQPTLDPEINLLLQTLLRGVQSALESYLAGMYLYGSLASGDFDPLRSDIDFAVATYGELPDKRVTALRELHTRLASSELHWAAKLEGAYVPLEALRRHDPRGALYPQVNEGQFYLARLGSDWVIQRHILREQGVVVFGPHPRPWIDPVSPDELRQSVRAILREWWAPMLVDPAHLHRADYQVYAILSMCRARHALQHGEIISKPAAARWAQQVLSDPLQARPQSKAWIGLIADALAWYPGESFDHFDAILEWIRMTLAIAG
jgi:predicted nucleotidyltransferase